MSPGAQSRDDTPVDGGYDERDTASPHGHLEAPEENAAMRCYRAAAEQGLPKAQLQLGDLYRAGLGVAEDPATAGAWYEKAAAQGNTEAAARLSALRGIRAG